MNSIVDYLKGQKQDSSFAARKAIAAKQGVTNYTGTAQQNTQLLNQIKGGTQTNSSSSVAQRQLTPAEQFVQAGQSIGDQERQLAEETANVQRSQIATGLAEEQARIGTEKEEINLAREEEATSADVVRQQALNPYSLQNEQMASSGLSGSGYEQSIISKQFTSYQSRLSNSFVAAQEAKSVLDEQFAQAYSEANKDLMNVAILEASSKLKAITSQYAREESAYKEQASQDRWKQEFALQTQKQNFTENKYNASVKAAADSAKAEAENAYNEKYNKEVLEDFDIENLKKLKTFRLGGKDMLATGKNVSEYIVGKIPNVKNNWSPFIDPSTGSYYVIADNPIYRPETKDYSALIDITEHIVQKEEE